MQYPITLTVIVDVPNVAPVSTEPCVPSGNYHFSTTKHEFVLVKDMHIKHVFNTIKQYIKEGLTVEQIQSSEMLCEMLHRLSTEKSK